MNQLRMVKLNMSDIPEAHIPCGFELRILKSGEKDKWEELCNKAFKSENDFHKVVEERRGYAEDGVFVITDTSESGKIVATGTALYDTNQNGYGYVHMIAADSDYSGKRLGYEITAAVLRCLRVSGLDKAELTTDDFRLPAIKTYYKLGFIPDLSVDETMRGRWENVYKNLSLELTEYI